MDNIVRDVCQECETEEVPKVPLLKVRVKDLEHSLGGIDSFTEQVVSKLIENGLKPIIRVQIYDANIKTSNISTSRTYLTFFFVENLENKVEVICVINEADRLKLDNYVDSLNEYQYNQFLASIGAQLNIENLGDEIFNNPLILEDLGFVNTGLVLKRRCRFRES